jgi:cell division transport system ATP-binding protein
MLTSRILESNKGASIVLESANLTYSGANSPAIADCSLVVKPGELVFLTGSSGSGKTSLLKLCRGDLRVTSGNITILGKNLQNIKKRHMAGLRRSTMAIFQDYQVLTSKNIYDNVAYLLEVTGHHPAVVRTRVIEALKLVGLHNKMADFPHQLSGGEQQRVAIARAFVVRPHILLADEPTGNLDPVNSDRVFNLLKTISNTGCSVLVATHDIENISKFTDRVVHMDHGVILSDSRSRLAACSMYAHV